MTANYPEAEWVIPQLRELCAEYDIEPIACEQALAWIGDDGRPVLAGTADMIAMVNGVKTVIDWKTGKKIYPDSGIKTAGYALATHWIMPDGSLEPLDEPIDQAMVVQLRPGHHAVHFVDDPAATIPLWLALREIASWQGRDVFAKPQARTIR